MYATLPYSGLIPMAPRDRERLGKALIVFVYVAGILAADYYWICRPAMLYGAPDFGDFLRSLRDTPYWWLTIATITAALLAVLYWMVRRQDR